MIPAWAWMAAVAAATIVILAVPPAPRKKSRAAVFYLISLGLAALAFLFHAATPRKRPAARHAAPKDDGQDWADVLRAINSPLRRRASSPGQETGNVSATQQRPARGEAGAGPGVPWADVDQYLTEDAKRYPAAFDAAHRILHGEIAPPWTGPQVGDITLDAPMMAYSDGWPRPEPPLRPLPPARACPDVAQVITYDPADELRQEDCCAACPPFIGDPGHCPEHHYGPGPVPDCPARTTQDVPGPAETASHPPTGAEAVVPSAASPAGPGTTTSAPEVPDAGRCPAAGRMDRAGDRAGQGADAVPDGSTPRPGQVTLAAGPADRGPAGPDHPGSRGGSRPSDRDQGAAGAVDDLDSTGWFRAIMTDNLGQLTPAQFVDQLFADAGPGR